MEVRLDVTKLSLGPMIGHVSSNGVRLWGRGNPGDRWGVIQYRRLHPDPDTQYSSPTVFRFSSWYDHAGIVDLCELGPPAASFEFRMGILALREDHNFEQADVEEAIVEQGLEWPTELDPCQGTFMLFPESSGAEKLRFLLGSCRENLTNGGERTFRMIGNHLDRHPCNFILMIGDQVYIDHLGWLASYEEDDYRRCYEQACSKPAFADVMRRLPTYRILDDHEIRNDWTGNDVEGSAKENGFKFYEAYQASMTPVAAVPKGHVLGEDSFAREPMDKRYWYDFSCGDLHFFVLDVRSEVILDDNEEPRLSQMQFDALKAWLVNESHIEGQVKFVVSSLPLFPDVNMFRGRSNPKPEKWGSARSQRRDMLRFIEENRDKCRRVVFLSGDVHVSFVSKAIFCDDDGNEKDFWVNQIVSSAFHWTLIGMQPGWFSDDRYLAVPDEATDKIKIAPIPKIHRRDGFGEVEADLETVVFKVFKSGWWGKSATEDARYTLEFPV